MNTFAVYALAAVIGFFGFIFIAGSQGQPLRVIVGVVLLGAAGALVYLFRTKPKSTTVVQQIDLSGDVSLEHMTCRNCGSQLTPKSIRVEAGAVFVNCEFCGTSYQLEEAPKW